MSSSRGSSTIRPFKDVEPVQHVESEAIELQTGFQPNGGAAMDAISYTSTRESFHGPVLQSPSSPVVVSRRREMFDRMTSNKILDRALERPHITGIAVSGTIGMGLFFRTGEMIGLAGSFGAVIAYMIAGAMISCVMICMSEMVTFRHEAGVIFDFPNLFVSPALGFAVGIVYWLAYVTSTISLVLVATQLLVGPTHQGGEFGIIIAIIITLLLLNFFGGVRFYGKLEWCFKWLKLFMILSLWVIMIYINRDQKINSLCWEAGSLFPPGFNGGTYRGPKPSPTASFATLKKSFEEQQPFDIEIPGTIGQILGVVTAVNVAIFGFIGIEILLVSSGESKRPRQDLPKAMNQMYIFTIILYTITALIVSFVVPWYDPELQSYGSLQGSLASGESPFIIAMRRSGIGKGFTNSYKFFFFFSAVTTANTNIYVASRTLFALASNTARWEWGERYIGSTSTEGTPVWAIMISIFPLILASIGLSKGSGLVVINVFSEIATVSFLCVYVSECWAFIQFQKGLGQRRNESTYRKKYQRVRRQPFFAWVGLVSCSFFIIINGWYYFYQVVNGGSVGEFFYGLVASYLGPVVFLSLYFIYNCVFGLRPVEPETVWSQKSEDDGILPEPELRGARRVLRKLWLLT